MEEHPFPDLKINRFDFLDEIDDRRTCPKCSKSRKYFCYTCFKPVMGTEDLTPVVALPVNVDILRHPNECAGKSTASHAAVLAPDHVTIYTYPCIPNYDKDKVVLVFPGPNTVTLEELSMSSVNPQLHDTACSTPNCSDTVQDDCASNDQTSTNSEETEPISDSNCTSKPPKRKANSSISPHTSCKRKKLSKAPFERVIFIDSTWKQTNRISKDERLKGIRCLELKTRNTKFWRHQRDKPNTYLSTIEAIYYFLRDYHELFVYEEYNGQYDNLLFFFCFMYQKIRGLYDGGHHLLAYKSKPPITEQEDEKDAS